MVQPEIRILALALLDDDKGISKEAWEYLQYLLLENSLEDIVSQVISSNGRFFLPKKDMWRDYTS